jgi:uncharacterized protein YbaP (TraB family)
MAGPPLWTIERAGSLVVLFGETVGLRDDGWLDDELRAAVAASRVLWCEADRDELAASPLLARYALADEPLSVRLDDGRLVRVHEVARGVGVEPATLEALRPWVAGQVLEVAMRSAAGYDPALGVDSVITALARAAGVPIRTELGDAEATFAWFDGMDAELEVDYLMWTVERVAAGHGEVDRTAAAWRRGDLATVAAEVRDLHRDHPRIHDRLLVDRNRAWVPRIRAMLDEPGTSFVLVGGAHLVGEVGVPACLAEAGLPPVRVR